MGVSHCLCWWLVVPGNQRTIWRFPPFLKVTSLQIRCYSISLPALFFHSILPMGLPMCAFFFRCLILTQKIAGFNSFARWLRKEQLTVSVKCLCQNPKQPLPMSINSRSDLLTEVFKVGWRNPQSGCRRKIHSMPLLSEWDHTWGRCRRVCMSMREYYLGSPEYYSGLV